MSAKKVLLFATVLAIAPVGCKKKHPSEVQTGSAGSEMGPGEVPSTTPPPVGGAGSAAGSAMAGADAGAMGSGSAAPGSAGSAAGSAGEAGSAAGSAGGP